MREPLDVGITVSSSFRSFSQENIRSHNLESLVVVQFLPFKSGIVGIDQISLPQYPTLPRGNGVLENDVSEFGNRKR